MKNSNLILLSFKTIITKRGFYINKKINKLKIKKPARECGLRRDTSLYIFISRLYHVSTKIRNGE
ncbi:hypothetical protein QUF11_12430, partial [Lactococcus lactis]